MSSSNPTNPKPSKSGRLLDAQAWENLKAAGFSEEEMLKDQPFGPVIFSYTRKEAIADGVLVDITDIARRVGFTLHTAVTCGAVAALTEMIRRRRPGDFEKYPLYRIQASTLWAMLEVLHEQIARQTGSADRLNFECGDLKLWAHVGPGDEGEPVLTVMLEGED